MSTFHQSFYNHKRESIAGKGKPQRFTWRGIPMVIDNQSTLHDARVLHLIQTIRGKYALPPCPVLTRPEAYTEQPDLSLHDALNFARDHNCIVLTRLSPLATDMVPIAPKDTEADLTRLEITGHGTYPFSTWHKALNDITRMETLERDVSKIHNAWRRARPNHWTPHVNDLVFDLEALDDENRVITEIAYVTFPKNGMGAVVRKHFNHERFGTMTATTTQFTVQAFYVVDGTPMRIEYTPHPRIDGFSHGGDGIYHLTSNDPVNRCLTALWNAPRHSAAPPKDDIMTHDQSTFRKKRDRLKTRRPKEQLSLGF